MSSVHSLSLFPPNGGAGGICESPQRTPSEFEDEIFFTEKEAVEFAWRIRRWKLEFNYTAEQNRWVWNGSEWVFQGEFYYTASYNSVLTPAVAPPNLPTGPNDSHISGVTGQITDEKYLVCPSSRISIQAIVSTTLNIIGGSSAGYSETYNSYINVQFPLISSFVSTNNYQAIFLSILNLAVFGSSQSTSTTGDLSGQVSFAGYNKTLKFKSNNFGSSMGQEPPPYQTGDAVFQVTYFKVTGFTFNLSPFDYFGYNPNDGGGPIYNTTTGQRIRFDV